MNRRRFLRIALVGTVAGPLVAHAQRPDKAPRIGVLLHDGAPPRLLEEFREGLNELGYRDGKSLTIEVRDAAGRSERLGDLADELVRLKVDVILAVNTPSAQAAKKATTTIPIVITRVGDPVRSGLVERLARPGGNVTGLSILPEGLAAKRIQLSREILPAISRIAVLTNADNPGSASQIEEMERATAELGLQLVGLPLRLSRDLTEAFHRVTRARAEAVFVIDDTAITQRRGQIIKLAADRSLPVFSMYKDFAEAGALIAYGPSLWAVYRRAAHYADKILKGTKPNDLPIEQPTKFELVINMKTAKALGLTIPPSLLLRADQVIE